jgi:hypothetical protein
MAYAAGWTPGMDEAACVSACRKVYLPNGSPLGYENMAENLLDKATEKEVLSCMHGALKKLGSRT